MRGDDDGPRLHRVVSAGSSVEGSCRNTQVQHVCLWWLWCARRDGVSSGRGGGDRSSGLAAVCQQLLEHATHGLHAGSVVLLELGLELVVQSADELLRGLMVSYETAL